MKKNTKSTKLTDAQTAWLQRQQLFESHPIYKSNLVRQICVLFDGVVVEVDGKKISKL
tara:strand:+ start:1334 stop:1507 length:174 start_codon:yes stop_codon:yes gene_type:complete